MRLLVNEPEQLDAAMMETLEKAASLCVRGEGIDPDFIEVSLSFVDPEEIRRLNKEFRGVDRVTDVLSFPLTEDLNELPGLEDLTETGEIAAAEETDKTSEQGADASTTDGDPDAAEYDDDWMAPLGDVVICLEQAEHQASEYGHGREREIVYLFVHSILHLQGYDHMEPEEKQEMRAREEEVMAMLGIVRS